MFCPLRAGDTLSLSVSRLVFYCSPRLPRLLHSLPLAVTRRLQGLSNVTRLWIANISLAPTPSLSQSFLSHLQSARAYTYNSTLQFNSIHRVNKTIVLYGILTKSWQKSVFPPMCQPQPVWQVKTQVYITYLHASLSSSRLLTPLGGVGVSRRVAASWPVWIV